MPPPRATPSSPPDPAPIVILTRWLVPDGARVHLGQPLCELDSDWASIDYEADRPGILHHLKREGDTITPGDAIAEIVLE